MKTSTWKSQKQETVHQALELFSKNPPGTFDLILIDLMMPVMDGFTATRKIRHLDRPDAKTIPIFAMTANAFLQRIYRIRRMQV